MKRVLSPLLAALIFFTAVLPATAATNTHDAIATTHVVQHGDTLYSIARQYGTSVDALMAMNGLPTNVIWVGQVLQIGSSSPSSPTNSYYTVVRGDTLYSIARRYGTTVEAIMQANHLTDTNIYVGRRLLIVTSSVPPIESTIHTVVGGDTLYSIARRYGTTVEAIIAANHLSSTYIYVGQRLFIASTKTPVAPTATVPTAMPTATTTPMPTHTPTVVPLTPTSTPQRCDPSYPDFCLQPSIPDLDCEHITYRNFRVLPPDPHGFDGNDNDGLGCESN